MDDRERAERWTREVCALLEADIRTSGATTLRDVWRATSVSLTSLMGEEHALRVTGTPRTGVYEIEIRGPTITGRLTVTLPEQRGQVR